MRARSALFLVTSAIAVLSMSCAAALSWDGFDDGTTAEGGTTEASTSGDAGTGDTGSTDAPIVDSPSPTAIAFVQESSYTDPEDNNAAVVSATFKKAQTKGNLVVVAVGWFDPAAVVLSVKDSKGKDYTRAIGPTVQPPVNAGAGPVVQSIYYAANINAAGAFENSVTVTFDRGAGDANVRILEYAGLDPIVPFDKAGEKKGVGTTASTDPITPSVPRALLVSAGVTWEYFHDAGPDFTRRSLSDDFSLVQDRIVNVQQAYTSTAPVLNQAGTAPESGEWVLQLAVFK